MNFIVMKFFDYGMRSLSYILLDTFLLGIFGCIYLLSLFLLLLCSWGSEFCWLLLGFEGCESLWKCVHSYSLMLSTLV